MAPSLAVSSPAAAQDPSGDGAGPRLAVIRAGMEAWVRERMLPRLVPVTPAEIADRSRAGRMAVLRRLIRALIGERARGRSGHWSYDLDRHLGLVQAVAAERAALCVPSARRSAETRRRLGQATSRAPGEAAQKETAADGRPRR